ncbi:hypothetical protein IJ182_03050 [bacterium]|nr:hypothetical protein [bacterium]
MKKILLLLILTITTSAAYAKNVPFECLDAINSEMETTEFKAKILKNVQFKSGFTFQKGDIVNMNIIKMVPAKSVKRSGYIVVQPLSIYKEKTICSEDNPDDCFTITEVIPIEDKSLEGKTTSIKVLSKQDIKQNLQENWQDDLKKAGKVVTKRVVNTALPGAEQIYVVSKGLIKPEEGQTRLQSATNNLIDDTPLKNLRKGSDINIKKGDKIFLKFYHNDIPKWRIIARNK